ncbi:MAG: hypothetical protein EON93_12505, partial [Burkholderiales bacterium]
ANSSGFTSPPYDTRTGYLRRSPAFNADRIKTPLLMQLGETEHREMLQLWSSLRDYGRAVEMIVYPEGLHIKNNPRQRLSVYQRNVDWVEFWLRGRERRGEATEYERWRIMREKQCKLFDDSDGARRPVYCD